LATREEIWQQYGIRAQRPLSEKTMRRIAQGVVKFVLENPKPFIITTNTTMRQRILERPLSTVTTVNSHMLIKPRLRPLSLNTMARRQMEKCGDKR
jgi:DNA (cytosine-5)-methyltransferase 1